SELPGGFALSRTRPLMDPVAAVCGGAADAAAMRQAVSVRRRTVFMVSLKSVEPCGGKFENRTNPASQIPKSRNLKLDFLSPVQFEISGFRDLRCRIRPIFKFSPRSWQSLLH